MKVILKTTVPKVGKQGQVVNVKDGFARNYLFPQGMAIYADRAQIKALDRQNAKAEAELEKTKDAAQAIADKIDGKHVRIEAKVGKGTKLFGAVTSQDIADAIKDQLGETFEKRQIGILQPIKQLGNFSVEIDIHRMVDLKVVVDVVDPEGEKRAEAEKQRIEAMAKGVSVEELAAGGEAATIDDLPQVDAPEEALQEAPEEAVAEESEEAAPAEENSEETN